MFDWWEDHFMWCGVALSALVVAGLLVIDSRLGAGLPRPRGSDAGAVLGTLASISGGLLGFVLAAATIAAGMLEKRSAWRVRSSNQVPAVWSMFISTTKWLGLLTAISLAILVTDSTLLTDPRWCAVVLFIALVAGTRIARCVWILELFLRSNEFGEVRK